ncbi:MAG: chromosome segregation protein SMC [Gemmatimonadota bacterium]|nr:chromosome segregation protein SMC [Gemmatimonadota bacterium]
MTDSSHQHPRWPYPGARWWKFDFHTHTPASVDYGAGSQEETITPSEWLLRFMRAEIDCVAVTDHNSGDWIDKLKSALAEMETDPREGFRPLYLFPGVELSVNGGFHLLAIFAPGTNSAVVDSLLGAVDYRGTRGDSDDVTGKSGFEVVKTVLEHGGIPIPAHADRDKGLFRLETGDDGTGRGTALDSNTTARILGCDGILAMEIVDRSVPKPDIYSQRKLGWAEVIGSDDHGVPGGGAPGSSYTWVKMAEPSLEGLRLALLDGDASSIIRSDEEGSGAANSTPQFFLESIEVRDARYMGRGSGAMLRFSPWMNALVGGRGTGKSTVIHSLRLALRLEDDLSRLGEGSDTLAVFERFNRTPRDRSDDGGLTKNTEIGVVVRRKGVRHRLTWRQNSGEPTVEDDQGGGWIKSASQLVARTRFPARVFSQGQIAEMAGRDQRALLQEIDKGSGAAERRDEVRQARDAFLATRARIRALESEMSTEADRLVVSLEDVERRLKDYEKAGHARILREYRQRKRQRAELERHFETAEEAAQRIERTESELLLDDLRPGLFDEAAPEDREALEVVRALDQAVRSASAKLENEAGRLRRAVSRQRTVLEKSGWRGATDNAQSEYSSFVDNVQEGVEDPSQYGRLVQERTALRAEQRRLESKREERDRLHAAAHEQFTQLLSARRSVTDCRVKFLASALGTNEFVKIEVCPYGVDPIFVERSWRKALGVEDDRFADDILRMEDGRAVKGIVAELLAGRPRNLEDQRLTVEGRLDTLRQDLTAASDGQGRFGGFFNKHIMRRNAEDSGFLDRLMTWFPEDGLTVEYSQSGKGTDFRPIGQASAGQRASAMLAFLLAHGEEPLVLDQPEDDLDNHLIYDLVVQQIRQKKMRCQLIVATHNPNIVVNGDAEMLHALDFKAGQCVVHQSGSLLRNAMREEVCRVMEGGREAFRRRYRRLGREVSGV